MASIGIAASAARSTSGNSAAVVAPRSTCAVLVDVTAVSGTTPSMALTVEWSNDGTTWFRGDPADSFTAITTASKVAKQFQAKGDYLRLVWTLTGTTPSFTFAAYQQFLS